MARRAADTDALCLRDDAPEAARRGLLEKDNGGKRCNGKNEHDPFQIVAREPAGKVEDEDDDRDDVKGVKSHILLTPRSARSGPRISQ